MVMAPLVDRAVGKPVLSMPGYQGRNDPDLAAVYGVLVAPAVGRRSRGGMLGVDCQSNGGWGVRGMLSAPLCRSARQTDALHSMSTTIARYTPPLGRLAEAAGMPII